MSEVRAETVRRYAGKRLHQHFCPAQSREGWDRPHINLRDAVRVQESLLSSTLSQPLSVSHCGMFAVKSVSS